MGASITAGQASFFLAYGYSMILWVYSELLHRSRTPAHVPSEEDDKDEVPGGKAGEKVKLLPLPDGLATVHANGSAGAASSTGGSDLEAQPGKGAISAQHHINMLWSMANCGLSRCLRWDKAALLQQRMVLRAVAEFGTLMVWYFLCDRTTVFSAGAKDYSRDVFLFIFVALTCVAFGASFQTLKTPSLLNRQQTEEWKGWMQVLFLLYHYFEAKEVYNAIRIFIAAYVWMTGFGNFSYYYKTADFSIGRFAQMLWRLNFLVFFVCVVLHNSYMLYYICPMHTIFTVMVYASLAIAPQLNQQNKWIWIKLALNFLIVFVFWDLKRVFYAVWTPWLWLVGYTDPRKPPGGDPMYEWFFRSSLDRYIWIYGMLCAFMYPHAVAALKALDEMAPLKRFFARAALLSATLVSAYFYYVHIYCLPKLEYNRVHPYTSWIPITLWMIVRNLTPTLRLHHLRLYGWLGCITLETYISQFSIWMKTEVPDGQPKALLTLIPTYPLLNFALCSGLYVLVSHRLFELTNALKNAAVPHSNNQLLLRNTIMLALLGVAVYAIAKVGEVVVTRAL